MARFCVLPYDDSSESSDDEEVVWMSMGDPSSDTNQPAVGSNVNGGWMETVAANNSNSPVVGFTANDRWMNATRASTISRDESSRNGEQRSTFLKKDAVSSCRQSSREATHHHGNSADDTESRWKQWNNNNSIAFVDSLNTAFTKLNDSIQERVQIEREKLEQLHRQEIQELQILRESLQFLKIETSRDNTPQESREEQNENGNKVIPMESKSELTSECERVDNTTRATPTVSSKSPKKNETNKESKAAKENIKASSESKTTTLKPEHELQAENLLAKLNELQKSIEPFSKDKSASKRRLKMKKTVCGKLNTLTDSAAKVKEVAEEVSAAIQLARQEDNSQSPNVALSELYLFDLFSSNIMQRIQADGFNGSRGDGFPLAATIAQVASENERVIPVLEAHVYKVCPMAIPRFPNESVSGTISEDELKQSLGMQREKGSGDFESWDRFASRTENTIAMVADIQASLPVTANSLFGGHQGAADWLKRFLESLPSDTTTLPLLTAPVLYGFLSGAGCMLANQHETLFKTSLQTLSNDVLDRLDKGAIGKPSFIRLSKLLENGFDGFRSNLPTKAIPPLYNNNAKVGAPITSVVQIPVNNPFTAGPKHIVSTTPATPATTATPPPISYENVCEDVEMTDAFDDGPTTTSYTFSSTATTTNTFGGNNMQFSNSAHVAAPFGFSAPPPTTTGWGAAHPPQGFGFGAGHDQLRNFIGGNNIQFSNSAHVAAPCGFSSPPPSANGWGSTHPAQGNGFGAGHEQLRNITGGNNIQFSNSAHVAAPCGFSSPPPNGWGSSHPAQGIGFGAGHDQLRNPFEATASQGTQTCFGKSSGIQFCQKTQPQVGNQHPNSTTAQHSKSNENKKKTKPLCKFFAKGHCRFGSKCRFSHESGDHTAVKNTKKKNRNKNKKVGHSPF